MSGSRSDTLRHMGFRMAPEMETFNPSHKVELFEVTVNPCRLQDHSLKIYRAEISNLIQPMLLFIISMKNLYNGHEMLQTLHS